MKLGRDKKRDVMNHVSTLVSLFLICSIRCIRLSYQLTGLFASFYGQLRMSFLSSFINAYLYALLNTLFNTLLDTFCYAFL